MVEKTLYPTVERTYSLEGLDVPPRNYGQFLGEMVRTFVDFTRKKRGEEYQQNDVELFMLGQLEFTELLPFEERGTTVKQTKLKNVIDRPDSPYGMIIPVASFPEAIEQAVGDFAVALDTLYPKRNSRVPEGDFFAKLSGRRDRDQIHYPDVFRLVLKMQCEPLGHLETYVGLRDYGSVFQTVPASERSLIPAVQLKVQRIAGSLEIPIECANELEKIVASHHNVCAITRMQSIQEDS